MSKTDLLNSKVYSGAKFSPCRKYRYSLWREWDETKSTCVFIGLNPSTANESEDDPTIRRCIQFAKDWGCGRLVMVNLFAYRATDPDVMKSSKSPVGKNNDINLLTECSKAELIIAAWGNHGLFEGRGDAVKTLLKEVELKCLKITVKGQPAHPLYQAADAKLLDFNF